MDFDLAIVGGGPAGISTALFALAEDPALRDRIVVLEKERYPRDKICAGAIGARADRLLASIGVRVDVPSAEVRAMSLTTTQGARYQTTPTDNLIGRVVRRVEFDHALAEQARARGIRVVDGARVASISFEQTGVVLQSDPGLLRVRAIVGADGVGSYVRRAVGFGRG